MQKTSEKEASKKVLYGFYTLLISSSLVLSSLNVVAGESKSIRLTYGWQEEAQNYAKQRATLGQTLNEKYRVLLQKNDLLTSITTTTVDADSILVNELLNYVPQYKKDAKEAGIEAITDLTAIWQLRNLWTDVRRRVASLTPGVPAVTWETLANITANNVLRFKLLELFRDDQTAGVPLTVAHSYGLIRIIGDILNRDQRGVEITAEMASYYLMQNSDNKAPDTNHGLNVLKNIDLGLAYTALAETFAVCPVENILWKQTGATPLVIYLDGIASGEVNLDDAFATLTILENRSKIARDEFALKNRKQYVDFCDKWLNENFNKLRQMLTLAYGD